MKRLAVPDLDPLREFANIGASWAAKALADLTGRKVLPRSPQVSVGDRPQVLGDWSTGVLFEIDGDLDGLVAILLEPAAADALARILVGEPALEDRAEVESALREFGNILASQMVSAIADTLGARVLISVPELLPESAEAQLAGRRGERRGARAGLLVESELCDDRGELRALVVFAPDPAKPAA